MKSAAIDLRSLLGGSLRGVAGKACRATLLGVAMALAGCGSPATTAAPAAATPAHAEAEAKAPASPASSEPEKAAVASVPSEPARMAAPEAKAAPKVEVVLGDLPPAPKTVPTLAILQPKKNQVLASKAASGLAIKLSVKGFELGAAGDHLCVVLDRRPCRLVDDLKAPLLLADLDPALDEGQHVLSVIARRGSGEFVRGAGKRAPFASCSFFVGKRVAPVWKDGAPMLFFSPPKSGPAPEEGVLIDYYVANAELSPGDYVLHASVGGPGIMDGVGLSIDAPRPLRLRNAQPGEYLARLSLFHFGRELGQSRAEVTVTSTSNLVPGPFSEVTRSFRVEPAAKRPAGAP